MHQAEAITAELSSQEESCVGYWCIKGTRARVSVEEEEEQQEVAEEGRCDENDVSDL